MQASGRIRIFVTLITKDEIKELPIMSKEDVADEIFNNILANRKGIV